MCLKFNVDQATGGKLGPADIGVLLNESGEVLFALSSPLGVKDFHSSCGASYFRGFENFLSIFLEQGSSGKFSFQCFCNVNVANLVLEPSPFEHL